MTVKLQEELKAAQEGKDLLASMVVDLENQLEVAKAEKAEAYVDNSSLANEVRRLEGLTAELTAERDGLVAGAAKEKGALGGAMEELQSQLDTMTFERDGAEKAMRRSEDAWRLERQNLEDQLRKARKFNDDLNEQLATKEIEHARALAEKQEAKHVSRSERQMRELFEGHLAEAKQHQDFLRTRLRELEAEAAEATAQYHKVGDSVYSLQDRCTELEQAKATLVKTAAAEKSMLQSELDALMSDLVSNKSDKEALDRQLKEVKEMLVDEKRANAQKTEQLAVAKADSVKLKNKLADSNDDENLLCQQVDQLKETVALLSKEKEGLLQQKSGEKETYMEELRVLRQALTMAERNTEAALTKVRTEKNQITGDMGDLAEQLAQSNAEVKSLQGQLDAAESAVAQALADKEELEGERRFLDKETKELASSLAQARVDKESRDVELAELQVLLRSQEVELQDDRSDLTRTKTDSAVLIRDQDEMRATFEKLRDENELLHAQVAQLNDHIQNVEVNNRRLELSAEAQPDVRGVVGENERMRDRMIALEEELAQTIATKEVDRSILEEQLHHAEARAEKAELVDEIEDKLREALEEIARLESELVQTRAEAAERDIQWQAEVDALAETYEQLQTELKTREREIEEMKEGAWLSAELQYMAKKVEDAEIAERKHVGEQKELIDTLEDKDAQLALAKAKLDEQLANARAMEEELNEVNMANRDVVREYGIVKDELANAVAAKDKMQEECEKFVKRHMEGNQDLNAMMKDSLTQLSGALADVKTDKARALAEKDNSLSEANAKNFKLANDLAKSAADAEKLAKELQSTKEKLMASLANSASNLGQTIFNYRNGLISSGMRRWLSFHTYAKLEKQIEELKFQLEVVQNKGKFFALKQVLGRWKNQGLLMGWREWMSLHEDIKGENRLMDMLNNMTADQKKRALERLNTILGMWSGDMFKFGFVQWKQLTVNGRQRQAKFKYAARQWHNRHLALGFNTWKYYATLSAEEQAEIEIRELQWRMKRTLQSWMKDKFLYEARLFTDAQMNRTFQGWKYHTSTTNKITNKVKMMIGTIKRDRTRIAFQLFNEAVQSSRVRSARELDDKLTAGAKKKALKMMGRIVGNLKNLATAKIFRRLNDNRVKCARDALLAAEKAALDAKEQDGYNRARSQLEAEIHFLQRTLRSVKGSAFAKYLDIFQKDGNTRGKTYCMGMWRSYTLGKSERLEEERVRKQISDLKDALKKSDDENQKFRKQVGDLNSQIDDLKAEVEGGSTKFKKQLRQLQVDYEAAVQAKEYAISDADLQKQYAASMLKNKEAALHEQEDEALHNLNRMKRQLDTARRDQEQAEEERDREVRARQDMMNRDKERVQNVEKEVEELKTSKMKMEQAERRLNAEKETLSDQLTNQSITLSQLRSEKASLNAEVQSLKNEQERSDDELTAVRKRLTQAEEKLKISGGGM
jgi:chromosome segregation ATPase